MEPHTEATPVPPLASLPHRRSPPPAGHTVSTAERGSFCLAVCTCGWSGPARRSRDLARKDADRHTAG
ncbi:hypothetical protein AMK16_31440 [Streptomyces sp. CB00455]|uniref:hypothetical protein n=1 Tax=Streptomyces sp. CB00455 TaxID=1703927 RepID=UPI00093FA735|nr:hypothetical protein [Streptomyces sp. CB00455]OKK13052.1 hypothetical protein AMK16_31440 [Streptomyces sp. CB00455]